MYDIPQTIQIKGQSYTIRRKGDYRLVLDCLLCLEDVDLSKEERLIACLILFYEDFSSLEDVLNTPNLEDLVHEMFLFFNCGEDSENTVKQNRKLMDWKKDSQLICAAVNKVAGTEIRALPYLHWWTFMGYYLGIGESLFSTVITIRDKITSGKKLEKHEKEFKAKNPQYFMWDSRTVEELEEDKWIKEIWNSGK